MSARNTTTRDRRKPKPTVQVTWKYARGSLCHCAHCNIRFITTDNVAGRHPVVCGLCGETVTWLRYVETGDRVEVTKG